MGGAAPGRGEGGHPSRGMGERCKHPHWGLGGGGGGGAQKPTLFAL